MLSASSASVCVRAFFAYGISRSIAHRSTLSAGHGQQILQFKIAEPGQRQIKPAVIQLAEFEPQQLRVPAAPGNRELIVGQHVSALLRLGPARSDHHWDLGDAELPRGEHASVARNQTTVLAHQRRRRPTPLLDARGDGRDLG